MPAKSKKQQQFMGMVHAAKKGEKPASTKVAKAAKGMTKKAVKNFASTKHKNLPNKVEETFEQKLHKILVEGILVEYEENGSGTLEVRLPFKNIGKVMVYYKWEGKEAPTPEYSGNPGHIEIIYAMTRAGIRIPAKKMSTAMNNIIIKAIMKHLNQIEDDEDSYEDNYEDNENDYNDHQYDNYHGMVKKY